MKIELKEIDLSKDYIVSFPVDIPEKDVKAAMEQLEQLWKDKGVKGKILFGVTAGITVKARGE
jgi:hypothetical protein